MQLYKRVTALDGEYLGTWYREQVQQTLCEHRAMCQDCHDNPPVLYRYMWETAGKYRSAVSGLFCSWKCYGAFHKAPTREVQGREVPCDSLLAGLGMIGGLWFLLSWLF